MLPSITATRRLPESTGLYWSLCAKSISTIAVWIMLSDDIFMYPSTLPMSASEHLIRPSLSIINDANIVLCEINSVTSFSRGWNPPVASMTAKIVHPIMLPAGMLGFVLPPRDGGSSSTFERRLLKWKLSSVLHKKEINVGMLLLSFSGVISTSVIYPSLQSRSSRILDASLLTQIGAF